MILFYYLALAFLRISLLVQYYRIFVLQHIRRIVLIVGIISAAFSICTIVTQIFFCVPIDKWWFGNSKPGFCVNRVALWYFNSIVHIFIDIAIVLIPIPVIKHLEIPRKQKRMLIFVFAMGGLACIVAIVRMEGVVNILKTEDLSSENADLAAWSSAEVNISVICASLPALRPFLSKWLPKILGPSWGSRMGTTRGGNTRNGTFKQFSQRGGDRDLSSKTLRRPRSSSEIFDLAPTAVESQSASDTEDIERLTSVKSKCWSPGLDTRVTFHEDIQQPMPVAKKIGQIEVVTEVTQQVQDDDQDTFRSQRGDEEQGGIANSPRAGWTQISHK
jgi:hypothetical protein